MTTAAPVARPGAQAGFDLGERIRNAPTPSRLRAFLYGAWALAALLFLVGEGSLREASQAMKTVGQDTAPSIIAAEEISSALADLDANAGNYLLGNKFHQAAATQAFEKQRTVVTGKLIDAAQNITYGDAERQPITAIFDGLGRYLERVAEMRYCKDTGADARALVAYTAATDIMHREMLPAADRLDSANYAHLQEEYKSQQRSSEGAVILAGLVAAALVVVLIWGQIFLFRRTRRILSLPLAGATIVAVAFGGYLVTRIVFSRADQPVAKEDAFESIRPLWQARAIAYDANGDESRWLLDRAHGEPLDQAYRDKLKKLASIPRPEEAMITAAKVDAKYQGLFAAELRNVTFPGERAAALAMIRAFAVYDRIDGKIRGLEAANKHADAVELCIGVGPDQSNAAFDRFDTALKAVIEINRKQFNETVEGGQRDLRIAETVLPLASLIIAALALLGIRVRLREYAA